jgi:hypothetical protein
VPFVSAILEWIVFTYRCHVMLKMDLFCVLFSAEMFRCVSEHEVIVNDVWHVYIVGFKFSG